MWLPTFQRSILLQTSRQMIGQYVLLKRKELPQEYRVSQPRRLQSKLQLYNQFWKSKILSCSYLSIKIHSLSESANHTYCVSYLLFQSAKLRNIKLFVNSVAIISTMWLEVMRNKHVILACVFS
jgi:hypothetical protein